MVEVKPLYSYLLYESAHEVTRDIDFVDDLLLQFLRHRKFDAGRAFRRLLNFTRFRLAYAPMFLQLPHGDDFFARARFFTVLPFRCPDGCTLLLYEMGKWDPDQVSLDELKQSAAMLLVQCLRDPMTQINGFKILYNLTGLSPVRHGRYCTPTNLYLVYHAGIDCLPAMFKEVHLMIDNILGKALWAIGKTFLSQKLKNRFFVHSSPECVLRHFPASVLPAEFGGVLEERYTNEWARKANEQHKGFTLRGQNNTY